MEWLVESDVIPYVLAILGLLGLWLFHEGQVRSGRIQAVDLFDRSVVRFYAYVLPATSQPCEVCAKADKSIFSMSQAAKKGFSPLEEACRGEGSCSGFMVGLYGGWPEAREIVTRLQRTSKKTILRLSTAELLAVVKGPWRKSISADTDRINVHLLQGLCFGNSDPELAVSGYRYVIAQAKENRHLPFVIPAYLLLLDVLLAACREDEARKVIEEFESRFPLGLPAGAGPSSEQRKTLEAKKSVLWKRQSLKVSA